MWHVFGADRVFQKTGWRRAERRLQELGVSYCTRPTQNTGDVQRAVDLAVDNAIKDNATQFAVAGGDGAANLLVNSLFRHPWKEPPTIGLLPLGTGCDFNRTFGISHRAEIAAELLTEESSGRRKLCDVGLVEGTWGKRYFLNAATIGLTAAAVQRASRFRWLGTARYLFGFFTSLPSFRARRFNFQSDEVLTQDGVQAVIANGRFVGNGFDVSPESKTNDGKLDVLMVAANRFQMLRVFQQVRSASHLTSPFVTLRQVRNVTVECERPTPIEIDGDYLGLTPARFSTIESAVRIQT